MKYGEQNKDAVIITQDKELIRRLENKKHKVIGVDTANLARMINEILESKCKK